MIENKKDLNFYLRQDMMVYNRTKKWPMPWTRCLGWKFQLSLRYHEYHYNQKGFYHKIMCALWDRIQYHYGIKLGWEIYPNNFGPGLKINHQGLIVVHPNVRVGAFCDIHQGVNIGQHGRALTDVPEIGDNVWIGPGAKIFGKIRIADECAIGANAVVCDDFLEKHICIAGNPATKVSVKGNPYIRIYC